MRYLARAPLRTPAFYSASLTAIPKLTRSACIFSWRALKLAMTAINGQREQLEGRLQQRYGYAKDQSKKEVDAWFETWK